MVFDNDYTTPHGWYWGIPFYCGLIRCDKYQYEADFHFVTEDYFLNYRIYVKSSLLKYLYKMFSMIDSVWFIIKKLLYKTGCFTLNPKNEELQWKYFLRLPRG